MRNESVDMTEFTRRIDCIYDSEEFERAMVWVKNISKKLNLVPADLTSSKKKENKGNF